MGSIKIYLIFLCCLPYVDGQGVPNTFDMDERATCGRTVFVGDSGVRLNGRGNVAPSQPLLECIVYLESVYANDDGTNKLQVEVENLQIKDCNVNVILYNGRKSEGRSMQQLSCQYSSTGIFYSTSREITVKFTRPDILVHNEYQFALLIKPYKDRDVPGTQTGVSSLSVAAIIGIIIGCLVLVGLIVLFLWCYCTGRFGDFNIPGRSFKGNGGIINGGMSHEKTNAEMMKVKDPIMFESQTDAIQHPPAPRLYQRNVPRNQMSFGRRLDSREGEYVNDQAGDYYNRDDSRWRRAPRHDYEPYNVKETVQNQKNERRETLIDDVFDSDSATKDTEDLNNSGTFDAETLQKRSVGDRKWSPKAKRKSEAEVPEEGELDSESPQLERYKSIDLQSQPDQDTIASPHHINAGVRANVEDENISPHGSLNRRNKSSKSPKSKRKGGKEPDPMAMPPEAFEPIFTAPITGIDYKSNQPNQAYGYPGYPPYGLIPAGMFAPGVPGTQTYAYAYQTVPPGGMPGQQGAWVVQNTPTADGNRRTAYVMEETTDPNVAKRGARNLTPESKRKHKQHRRKSDQEPDLSIVARGAAPPDPGQGHRSIAMKSGTDPHSGIHTTQVVWTDTAPDPSDPKPGENPQVTRKTVTRVTTKSGYGDLPATGDPLMLLDGEEEPAFLSPSKNRIGARDKQPAFLEAPPVPSASTPDKENIDFYTGPVHSRGKYDHHSVPPPERTSTPQIPVHQHPSYNSAIRDRIPFDDSTV